MPSALPKPKKKGPGDAPLGQCKGRCCSEGSVPALLIS